VRLDPLRPERPPQAVDVDLERPHRRGRRGLAPERVDETIAPDNLAGPLEERALLGRAEWRRAAVGGRLERLLGLLLGTPRNHS
jgi:hypothetical protein